jgi:hypothetical protein
MSLFLSVPALMDTATRRIPRTCSLHVQILALMVALGGPEGGTVSQAVYWLQAAEQDTATMQWEMIKYPDLQSPWRATRRIHVELCNDGSKGLCLRLSWFRALPEGAPLYGPVNEQMADAGDKEGQLNPQQTVVRLYLTNQEPVQILPDQRVIVGIRNSRGTSYQVSYHLPSLPNGPSEFCVEVNLHGALYWLEVPYGFPTASTTVPTIAGENGRRIARAAPKQGMGEGVRHISWQYVRYRFGPERGLIADIANPFQGAQVRLSASAVAPNLTAKPIDVAITGPKGEIAHGKRSTNLQFDGGFHVIDTFDLGSFANRGHFCSTLVIRVNDKKYATTIPSSLLSGTH